MKTIKQIADEIGIAKQRVYRYIKQSHINETHQERNVMYYDDVAEMQIKKHFSKEKHINETHQSAYNETVVNALLKQLEIKDKQIADLTESLKLEQLKNTSWRHRLLLGRKQK